MMQLWSLREQENSTFNINVKFKAMGSIKNKDQPEELTTIITGWDIQRIFGVRCSELTKSQLYLITYLYMKTLTLCWPPSELNQGNINAIGGGDTSSDEDDAKVIIKQGIIEHICGYRRMIRIDKAKLAPVTITLLGCNKVFLGIRVVIFDTASVQESGFFFTVKQDEWLKPQAQDKCASPVPKRSKGIVNNGVLKDKYLLGEYLLAEGVAKIIDMLVIGKNTHSLYLQTKFENVAATHRTGTKSNQFTVVESYPRPDTY